MDADSDDPEEQRRKMEAKATAQNLGAAIGMVAGERTQDRSGTGYSHKRTNTNLAADHVTVCCLPNFQKEVLLKTCIFLAYQGNNFISKGGGQQ